MSAPVEVMVRVECPRVPNFLRLADRPEVEGSTATVPIADLSEDSLNEIGAEWTARLIERAREQRAERGKNPKGAEQAQRAQPADVPFDPRPDIPLPRRNGLT